jgi:hypothetical protein
MPVWILRAKVRCFRTSRGIPYHLKVEPRTKIGECARMIRKSTNSMLDQPALEWTNRVRMRSNFAKLIFCVSSERGVRSIYGHEM